MPKKGTSKVYRVCNPYRLPSGTPLIQWKAPDWEAEKTWYENDTLSPPPTMKIDRLLSMGYLMEVTNHG